MGRMPSLQQASQIDRAPKCASWWTIGARPGDCSTTRLPHLAPVYAFSRADPEESRTLFEQALALLREIGATWEVGFVIEGMGHFAFGRGAYGERFHGRLLVIPAFVPSMFAGYASPPSENMNGAFDAVIW